MLKKSLLAVGLLLSLRPGFGLVPLASAQSGTADADIADYADYLSDHYDLVFTGDVDQAQFTDALTLALGEVETPPEIDLEGFAGAEAVLTSLYYANLDELAFTFPEDAVAAALSDLGDAPNGLEPARQQELTTAIDTGLYDPLALPDVDLAAPVSADLATYLLGQVLDRTGHYKNFLGYISDPDIHSRLVYAWNSFDQVLAPDLQAPAVDLIREGVISGYNLKRVDAVSNFDPDRTLIYGHANIDHALQLIALLRSQGIDGKVLLEPKTSAYLSLAEWGDEPPTSPDLQSDVLDDGNWITYAKEYDLSIEFETEAERDQFDALIQTYAQRSETDPVRLLGSWWVPLYSSRVPLDDYAQVYNHVVYQDQFFLQSFSLIENTDAVNERFVESFPEGEVEIWEDLWVNNDFYDYLIEATT